MKEFFDMMKEDFEARVIIISVFVMLLYMSIAMLIADPAVSILTMCAALPLMVMVFLVVDISIDVHRKHNKK